MFEPNWDSLKHYSVPDWYVNGKFGIFIHWGVYCVPAFGNEWYPRNMYVQGSKEFEHHVATYGQQSEFGYKDFIPRFKAEQFNADAWVELCKRAGAKFVVPVAEHHDGFAMYDTRYNRWNAAAMGPKRDVIGELAVATRRHDMVFGLSSHRAEHWWFFDEGRKFDSDVNNPANADLYGPAYPRETNPDKAYLDDWLLRTAELVDKYQPQLVWFDWWIEEPAFVSHMQRFAAYYYNRGVEWSKGVAINYKFGPFPSGTAVLDIERGQLKAIRPTFWQNDTSVSKNSWGYVHNQDYKTANDIIADLADVVSKNGALLLNVGPKPDGTIPEPEQQMLLEIGDWLAVNGEAIYGTRPWRAFGEGPTQVHEGAFTDTKRAAFTPQDIRFTAKGHTLYVICLAPPQQEVRIKSLASSRHAPEQVTHIQLLGSDAPLTWSRGDDGLTIRLTEPYQGKNACAFRITLV
jgi:alpha-L-fucosidase